MRAFFFGALALAIGRIAQALIAVARKLIDAGFLILLRLHRVTKDISGAPAVTASAVATAAAKGCGSGGFHGKATGLISTRLPRVTSNSSLVASSVPLALAVIKNRYVPF